MQKITKEHIPLLLEIYNQSFPIHWKENDFIELLNQSSIIGFINENLSFILIQTTPPEAEIITIATHPLARGKGLAKKLLNEICNIYDTIFLEVRQSNVQAISLYESMGFVRTGVRKKYYEKQEDAIIMNYNK